MDTIEGRGPAPAFVISWIDGLPEGSMTVSMMRDLDNWRDYFGKDPHWYVLADIYDATNQTTRATGSWKKGPPKFDPYPRPGRDKAGKKKGRSLSDLYGSFGGSDMAPLEGGGDLWQVQQ